MKKIAIIEDDKGLNQGIVLALKSENYQFEQYYSLAEATKIEADGGVDLIILDINLPDGNGFEYLKQVRKKFPTRQKLLYPIFFYIHSC